jgi:hypothetical protein
MLTVNTAGIDIKLEKASGINNWKLKHFERLQNALYIVDGEQITEEQFRLISPSDIIAIDPKGEKSYALYGNND